MGPIRDVTNDKNERLTLSQLSHKVVVSGVTLENISGSRGVSQDQSLTLAAPW